MESSVRASRRDGVLLLQLDSPEGFPRLTRKVLGQLHEHFEDAARLAGRQGMVITGTEQAFAAGADLEEVSALDALEALRFSALGQQLMSRIERCPVPVIAAIRGYCLGGGFDLAMACHLRVAATDATFGHPGGSLGIITGWGGTARLPRLVGCAGALELLTTGRIIDAKEAYRLRMVNRLESPDRVLDTALRLLRADRDRA